MLDVFANLKDLISYSTGGILSKELVKSDVSNVSLFCMASGTAISEHTANKEAVIYVLEGKGKFILEKKEMEMISGVMIKMRKGQIHELKALENLSFLLFLFG